MDSALLSLLGAFRHGVARECRALVTKAFRTRRRTWALEAACLVGAAGAGAA